MSKYFYCGDYAVEPFSGEKTLILSNGIRGNLNLIVDPTRKITKENVFSIPLRHECGKKISHIRNFRDCDGSYLVKFDDCPDLPELSVKLEQLIPAPCGWLLDGDPIYIDDVLFGTGPVEGYRYDVSGSAFLGGIWYFYSKRNETPASFACSTHLEKKKPSKKLIFRDDIYFLGRTHIGAVKESDESKILFICGFSSGPDAEGSKKDAETLIDLYNKNLES